MELKEKIEQFILTEVNSDIGLTHLGEDDALIDSGIIDSLGILKILSFLDEEFGLDLSSEVIRPEKFATIKSICELIKNKG
jgi:acyl carrier protein